MTYRLDVVSVGVDYERPVVNWMVMRPHPRAAIVLCACGRRRVREIVDRKSKVAPPSPS